MPWENVVPGGADAEEGMRPFGLSLQEQRAVRRGLEQGYGGDWQWTRDSGEGMPAHWVRLAEAGTAQWRLMERGREARHVEAFWVSAVPTVAWSSELQKEVKRTVIFDAGRFDAMRAIAWEEAEADYPSHRPRPFAWEGSRAMLPFVEGSGGIPIGMLLRCRRVCWEVLAASRSKAWIRVSGWMGRGCGAEELWWAPSFHGAGAIGG